MHYPKLIYDIGADAEQLELAYQQAAETNESGLFSVAIDEVYAAQPGNLLYAAWHYRLVYAVREQVPMRSIAWAKAALLAIINGAILWLLSSEELMIDGALPEILFLWSPISALAVLIFLAWAGGARWSRLAVVAVVVAALTLIARVTFSWIEQPLQREHYLVLMAIHMPLLAWAGIGSYALAGEHNDNENRFAFLLKSLEVFIVGGLFAISGGIFVSITIGLFDALGIVLEEWTLRLLLAGGAGLLPLLAVAVVYDPNKPPAVQSFEDGLSRLIATLMRLLLPLTLLVLLVYVAFIPFNFWKPFENRDVLIVYSGMLFAVIALLVGATPAVSVPVPEVTNRWLRRGILLVAALAGLVGLYALAAISYRTWQEGWTPNRVAFVGWNAINVVILTFLLVRQARDGRDAWLPALYNSFGNGALLYAVWTVVVIVTLPWLF